MLNSQDLRYMGQSGEIIPRRAEVIIGSLQKYFVEAAVNKTNRLMVRFRSKGGQIDSVRQSMNSGVIDIFTTKAVRDQILLILRSELGFETEFVEEPYCFYILKWSSGDCEITRYLDHRNDGRVLVQNTNYYCDTSTRSFVVKLPTDASTGDYVVLRDRYGTFNKHVLVVSANGSSIMNECAVNLDINFTAVKFIFNSNLSSWSIDFLI